MSRDQIEEIAWLIDEAYDNAEMTGSELHGYEVATHIYNAGYRKQSEVIDEFAERLKKRLYDKPSIFTQQRYIVNDEIDNLVEEMKGGAE